MEQTVRTALESVRDAPVDEVERVLEQYVRPFLLADGAGVLNADTFVVAAEIAVRVKSMEFARACLDHYFLASHPPSQFLARAFFARALVVFDAAKSLPGVELTEPVLIALNFIAQGVKVARANSRHNFLVYNGSIHYWRICRPLCKDGFRAQLLPTLAQITKGLEDTNEQDSVWLCRFLILTARCYEEAGNVPEAVKASNAAAALAVKFSPELRQEAWRLQIHVTRTAHGGGKEGNDRHSQNDSISALELKAVTKIQLAKSSLTKTDKDAAFVQKSLEEAFAILNGQTGESPELQQLLVEVGLLAAQHGMFELANHCTQSLTNPRSLGPRILREYVLCAMAIELLGAERERFTPKMVDSRLTILKRLERAVISAVRLGDVLTVETGCVQIWNTSLPLLQRDLRMKIHKILLTAASALEDMDSAQFRLRSQLHYEIALCEVEQDTLAKAQSHVERAMQQDMTNKLGTVKLKDLSQKLTLRTHIYSEDNRSPHDEGALLIEQAKSSKDAKLRASILERAVTVIGTVHYAEGTHRQCLLMWSETAKMSWLNRFTATALKAVEGFLESWREEDNTLGADIVLLKAEMHFIHGEILILKGREKGISVLSALVQHPLDAESIEEEGTYQPVQAFLEGLRIGLSLGNDPLIINAATYIWNYYLEIFRNEQHHLLCTPLLEVYEALTPLASSEPTVFAKFANTVAKALLQRYQAKLNEPEAVPTDGLTSEVASREHKEPAKDSSKKSTTSKRKPSSKREKDNHRGAKNAKEESDVKLAEAACHAGLAVARGQLKKDLLSTLTGVHAITKTIMSTTKLTTKNDAETQLTLLLEQIVQNSNSDAERKKTLTAALQLLEQVPPSVEMFARLGREALLVSEFNCALDCAKRALRCVDNEASTASLSRWRAFAECIAGEAYLGALGPDNVSTRASHLRIKALAHFAQGVSHGALCEGASFVLMAARQFWNCLIPEFARNDTAHMQAALPLTNTVVRHLSSCYSKSPLDVGPSFMLGFYCVLLDLQAFCADWRGGLDVIDDALRVLPRDLHSDLWERRMVFQSRIGKDVSLDISRVDASDDLLRAKMWINLARASANNSSRTAAYEAAIEILTAGHPLECADVQLEYCEFLYNSNSTGEALDVQLKRAEAVAGRDDLNGGLTLLRVYALAAGNKRTVAERATGCLQVTRLIATLWRLCYDGVVASEQLAAGKEKEEAPKKDAKDKHGSRKSHSDGRKSPRADHRLSPRGAKHVLNDVEVKAVAVDPLPLDAQSWSTFIPSDAMRARILASDSTNALNVANVKSPDALFESLALVFDIFVKANCERLAGPVCGLAVFIAEHLVRSEALLLTWLLRHAAALNALGMHKEATGKRSSSKDVLSRLLSAVTGTYGDTFAQNIAQSGDLLRRAGLFEEAKNCYEKGRALGTSEDGVLARCTQGIARLHWHKDCNLDASLTTALSVQNWMADPDVWTDNALLIVDLLSRRPIVRFNEMKAMLAKTISKLQTFALSSRLAANVARDCGILLRTTAAVNFQEVQYLDQVGRPWQAAAETGMSNFASACEKFGEAGFVDEVAKTHLHVADVQQHWPTKSQQEDLDRVRRTVALLQDVESSLEREYESAVTVYQQDSPVILSRSLLVTVRRRLCEAELHLASLLSPSTKSQRLPAKNVVEEFLATFEEDQPEEKLLPAVERGLLRIEGALSLARTPDEQLKVRYLQGRCLMMLAEQRGVLVDQWLVPAGLEATHTDQAVDEHVSSGARHLKTAVSRVAIVSQAAVALSQSVDLAIANRDLDVACASARLLVNIHGAHNVAAAARYVCIAQSAAMMKNLFKTYLASCSANSREKLAYEQRQLFAQSLHYGIDWSAWDENTTFFSTSSVAWQRTIAALQTPIESIVPDLPHDTVVVVIDHDPATATLTGAVFSDTGRPAAARVPCNSELIAGAVQSAAQFRASLASNLLQKSKEQTLVASPSSSTKKVGVPRLAASKSKLAPDTVKKASTRPGRRPRDTDKPVESTVNTKSERMQTPLEREFGGIVSQTEDILGLILESLLMNTDDLGNKNVVLIVDSDLQLLPLEAISVLTRAGSVTRDFSIHMLHARLVKPTEGEVKRDNIVIPRSNISYVVDPRNEHTPSMFAHPKGAPPTIEQLFTKDAAGSYARTWSGVMGSHHIASPEEWQELLSTNSPGGFVYLGLERMLACVPPQYVAGLNLTGCRMAVLLDGVQCDESHRRQSQLDVTKSPADLSLETPRETAALLSACGANCVVLNTWATTAPANQFVLSELVNQMIRGVHVGKAVQTLRKARPVAEEEGTSTSTLESPLENIYFRMNAIVYGVPNLTLSS